MEKKTLKVPTKILENCSCEASYCCIVIAGVLKLEPDPGRPGSSTCLAPGSGFRPYFSGSRSRS